MAVTKTEDRAEPSNAARAKSRISRLCRAGLGLGLALSLAACATLYRNHGYVPAPDELAKLQVGKDTRESVAPKVGRPSASGLLNDDSWFYVQSRWEHRGAFAPKEIDRQVVALSFNDAGVLTNVERFGLERGKIVPISRRVTETSVQGQSALRQIFSNFGRVDAGDLFEQ